MRYLKVLLLAVFFFLAMIFFFQNQQPLSQQTELGLNLFFIPPMKSIPLPFYFIVIAAFFVGCIMTLSLLLWDKFTIGARLVKAKWQVSSLERQVNTLQKKYDAINAKALPPAVPTVAKEVVKDADTKAEVVKADKDGK